MEEFSLYDIGCACLALLPILAFGVLLALAFISICPPVYAAEQITNGNFETGDFTGWTIYGSPDVPVIDTAEKHGGTYSAKVLDSYRQGGIEQQIDLTGVTNISYWTYHYGSGMVLKVDGDTIYTEGTDGSSGWIWRNISVSYTGTHWVNWTGNQDNNWWIDDISANATSTQPDTTPPLSITGLSNTSVSCSALFFNWTNPATDYGNLLVWRNNTALTNLTNVTIGVSWTGLPASTDITFSSKTCDIAGNCNASFVNMTRTTVACDPSGVNVSLVGDSIMQGQTTTYNGLNGMGGYILDDHSNWSIVNTADGGLGWDNLVTSFTQDVIEHNSTIVIAECGINDISGDRTVADITDDILEYESLCDAAGATLYLNTVEPTELLESTKWDELDELNDWIRCNFTPNHGNRYYFDLFETLEDPAAPYNITDAYTYDGQHLTDAGYQAWGEGFNSSFPDAEECAAPPTPTPTPSGIPVPSFVANVTCGRVPFYVLFTDTSTGIPTEWNWSSNGNYSDEQNPVFFYDTVGRYSVNLNATNSFGSSYFNRTDYIRAVPEWYECPPVTTAMIPNLPAPTDFGEKYNQMLSLWWLAPLGFVVLRLIT